MNSSAETVVAARRVPLLEAEREVVTVDEVANWPGSVLFVTDAALMQTDQYDLVIHIELIHLVDG